jgi:hypothetical protein
MSTATAKKPLINLNAYHSNLGVFIHPVSTYQSFVKWPDSVRINGVLVTEYPKFGINNNIIKLESIDNLKVEILTPGRDTQVGWQLMDESLASDKIPLTLTMEELHKSWCEEDDDYLLSGPKQKLGALYKEAYTRSEDAYVEAEISITNKGAYQIDNLYSSNFSIKLATSQPGATVVQLKDIATFEEIAKMLVPELLIANAPCRLSGTFLFNIIRAYIRDNINSKYAKITADSNNYFIVARRVITQPTPFRKEVLTRGGNSYRPPRFQSSFANEKYVQIFSMASPDAYGSYHSYGLVSGLEANSLVDLYEKLGEMLNFIIREINLSVSNCPHCEGTGLVEAGNAYTWAEVKEKLMKSE